MLEGEIDLATSPQLEAAFDGLGPDIVVDMRNVSFMDSSGIGVLVRVKERDDDCRIRIVGNEKVLRILELTGLTSMFQLVPDPGMQQMAQ